jgi:hypothetical protein
LNLPHAIVLDEPKISEAFKTGKGVGWNDRAECLFCGPARFFRASYQHHLVQEWLPALDGVVEKLKRGAKVADVGCGHGISTRLMAKAFPKFPVLRLRCASGLNRCRAQGGKGRRVRRTSVRPRPPSHFLPMVMTLSASSIACMTWAIRPAP